MKKILCFSFLFFSFSAMSKVVDVRLINREYNILINASVIQVKSHDLDLSLVKSTCNSRIFDQTTSYYEEIFALVNSHEVAEKKEESFIVIDKIKTFVNPFSRLADYLRNLPNKLIESKLKEKIVCSKKEG